MKLNEAMNLFERNVKQIAKDYETLRNIFIKTLQTKSEKAEYVVKTWLGGIEDAQNIDQLKSSLEGVESFKNDKVDSAILKIASSILDDKSEREADIKSKRDKAETRRKELTFLT